MGTVNGRPWKGRAYLRAKHPRAFPLSESQFEVLEGLAKEGSTNGYRIAKKTGKAYSFVFNSLRELERRKLIFLKGVELTKKGTKAKIYSLTLEGVLRVLQRELLPHDSSNHHPLRKIIDSHRSMLPLVFGKWSYFENLGKLVKKIAWFRLKVLVDTFVSDPTSFTKWVSYIGSPEMGLEQKLTWLFYFQFNHFNFGEDWENALTQDKETKVYVVSELRAYQERLRNQHNLIENTISLIEKHDGKK